MTNKKFTKEELKQIQDLNVRITQLTTQMGQIYYSKIKLEDQELKLKKELLSIEAEEAKVAEQLTKKYGKGSLDIDSGEFTPS